ncbi:helix-turn-helix domain-containing protein [Mesorhizobium sp. M0387]|uniref:helix-turn-helix domain-containing protein n=1 Tax=Mesorhizobium sp. M0387 TaxID=2956940 RepID=UPI00333573D5
MDMRKLVGRNFARLRGASGLTQEQVAERANVSQQYVSGLENGKRNPTIQMLFQIAKALGVSHVDLVMPTEQQGQSYDQPPDSST